MGAAKAHSKMALNLEKKFFKYGVYYPVTLLQGGDLRRPLNSLRKTQYANPTHLKNLQLEKLQSLIRHAKTSVPWYRTSLQDINPALLTSLDKMSRLPLLAKADIQSDAAAFHSQTRAGRVITKTSGGSTGEPLTVIKSRYAWINELAATWRGYNWAGIDIGDLQARFWGVPLDGPGRWQAQLTDWICHRIRCSAFSFDEQDIEDYWAKLKARQPDYFYGYVSMLVEFAEHIKRTGQPAGIQPKGIITTSEILTDKARQVLASVFDTRVYNEYGCGEIGTIAHECEAGNMHLSEENIYVEIVSEGRVCEPGESGEIVVTELNNRVMPLIRYRMGDYGSISNEPCTCGRALRVLDGLHGRAYDFVYSGDGRRFHGEFMMYIFEGLKKDGVNLRQFQVHQLDIRKFLIRIVPEKNFDTAAQDKVIATIHEHVDADAKVEFEMVDKINREASGKMRVIVGMPGKKSGEGR